MMAEFASIDAYFGNQNFAEIAQMTPTVIVYVIYTLICSAIVAWVGRTLQHSAPAFMVNGKRLSKDVVESITHLLVVGFYLIASGAICFFLKSNSQIAGAEGAMEVLSVKIGFVLVVTGVIHFYLVATLVRFRNYAGDPSVVSTVGSNPQVISSNDTRNENVE